MSMRKNHLTASVVLERVRRSFNAAKVTKAFYRAFSRHRKVFVNHIEGNLDEEDPELVCLGFAQPAHVHLLHPTEGLPQW